jgi:hypothetical protein
MLSNLMAARIGRIAGSFHADEEGNETIQTVGIVAIAMIILAYLYKFVWGGTPGGDEGGEGGGISKWLTDIVGVVTKFKLPG